MIRIKMHAFIFFLHATCALAHTSEHVEHFYIMALPQQNKNTLKKHLLWRKIGTSVVAATVGTFAVTILDSICNEPTYPAHESIKWWLACLFGTGFSTFYTLCLETWPELGSPEKAYYIARLILYYASIKGAYALLNKPAYQHYLVDELHGPQAEHDVQEQQDTLFNMTGSVTLYKHEQ